MLRLNDFVQRKKLFKDLGAAGETIMCFALCTLTQPGELDWNEETDAIYVHFWTIKKKKERLLACSMTAASLTTTHRVNFRCTFLRHQFSPQKHSPPLPEVTHRLGDKESVCWRSIPVDDVETDSPMSKCNLLASYVACLSVHWPLWDLVLRYWMTRHFVILDRK